MLARALALNPKVLLLDDFTARVDSTTERDHSEERSSRIIRASRSSRSRRKSHRSTNYDQIILLMEGEVLATGTHQQLMETSPEYVQIYDSQRSTSLYEVHA